MKLFVCGGILWSVDPVLLHDWQVDMERGERLKLEHAVKTGSLPDDAKMDFSSVSALAAAHAKIGEITTLTNGHPAQIPLPGQCTQAKFYPCKV